MAVVNEIGNKYGRLTVLERGPNNSSGSARWVCQCECGNPNTILVLGSSLRNGHTKSCGCLHNENARKQGLNNRKSNKYDLTGEYGIGYTSKNEPFYFDIEDYDKIKDYCWYIDKSGYVCCKRDKAYYMHRIVMDAPEDKLVDHIYHETNDNRKSQLRLCDSSENHFNEVVSSRTTSGIKGVYWYSQQQKWSAEILVRGEKHFLGLYNSKEEAEKIRKEAEEKYFGEFSYKERGDAAYENC